MPKTHESVPKEWHTAQQEIVCRPLELGDMSQLLDLCQQHADYEGFSLDLGGKQQEMERLFFAPDAAMKCWVIESGEALLAYASCIPQQSTWMAEQYLYLDCLFVVESARDKGLGSMLMAEITRYARTIGCKTMQWQTPVSNEVGIKFYDRLNGTQRTNKWRYCRDLNSPDALLMKENA